MPILAWRTATFNALVKDNQHAKNMGKECSEEKETVCHKSQGKIISQKEGLSSLVNIMNKYQMKMRKKEIRKHKLQKSVKFGWQ